MKGKVWGSPYPSWSMCARSHALRGYLQHTDARGFREVLRQHCVGPQHTDARGFKA